MSIFRIITLPLRGYNCINLVLIFMMFLLINSIEYFMTPILPSIIVITTLFNISIFGYILEYINLIIKNRIVKEELPTWDINSIHIITILKSYEIFAITSIEIGIILFPILYIIKFDINKFNNPLMIFILSAMFVFIYMINAFIRNIGGSFTVRELIRILKRPVTLIIMILSILLSGIIILMISIGMFSNPVIRAVDVSVLSYCIIVIAKLVVNEYIEETEGK